MGEERMIAMRSILIYGLGAIGSVLAGYLSKKFDVYAVGRKWHVEEISENRFLEVNVLFKNTKFKANLTKIGSSLDDLGFNRFDVVFITTKAYDLGKSLNDILDHGIETDCYVLFQNGLKITETAVNTLSRLKKINIVRAITYLAANISEPGKVNHAGLGETYIGGVYGNDKDMWARSISEALNSVELPSRVIEDIRIAEFEKVIVNATINPITALLRIRNGRILKSEVLKEFIKNIINEILLIAEKMGIKLEGEYDKVLEIARITRKNLSSMLQDILRGKKTEIDYINGAIVKMGKELGIRTPYNEAIYQLVKGMEDVKIQRVKN